MEYRVNTHWFINSGDFPKWSRRSIYLYHDKFKSNNMVKWSDIRELWMGYTINLESTKYKKESILLLLVLVVKKTYCVREYSNISLFIDKKAWFSLLIWILKSLRITVNWSERF